MKSEVPLLVVFLVLTLSDSDLRRSAAQQMRVAPGVPPQQYQPPQHQQQFQQPPQHHQQQQNFQHQQQFQPPPPPQQQFAQQPVQHQQQQFQQPPPPPQQGHVPVQQQQAAGGHGHAHPSHGHHGGGQPLLDGSNINNERAHIQEHMSIPIDTSQMSEQELQFHYFKMHDADNNNKLDGCELVKSLIHWHDQANHDPKAGQPIPEAKIFNDEELINMIDPILKNDDKNGDGFIDYAEFSLAQASAAAKAKQQQ